MCSMVAAAHQSGSDTSPVASLVNSLALAGHMPSNGAMARLPHSPCPEDLRMSPANSALDSPLSSPLGLTMGPGRTFLDLSVILS